MSGHGVGYLDRSLGFGRLCEGKSEQDNNEAPHQTFRLAPHSAQNLFFGGFDTLLFLTLIALVALGALGALEVVRGRSMVKLGTWLDARLSVPVLAASLSGATQGNREPSIQGLRDLSTLRGFVTGSAVFPILDAPWTPLFLAVIFLLHPLLGLLALSGAAILLTLALGNDLASRRLIERSGGASIMPKPRGSAAMRLPSSLASSRIESMVIARMRRRPPGIAARLIVESFTVRRDPGSRQPR